MQRLKDMKALVGLRRSKQGDYLVENTTMLEGFEWFTPNDGLHWKRLQRAIPELKAIGISNIWIPPGCKGSGQSSSGYDLYDLYDLGEFDQKGSRRTKWGSREDLQAMMSVAKAAGVGIYWDAVLNHKAAADYTEKCQAVKVSRTDRTKNVSEVHEIEVWTGYEFAARNKKYSSMKYHWHHFSGTDYEARLQSTESIYRFVGKDKPGWAKDVDDENGNADYLMFNDLDYSQQEVRDDICNWGDWIVREVGVSGFRIDAIKHFSASFLKAWIAYLDQRSSTRLFMVGEYWKGDPAALGQIVESLGGRLHLFDICLAGKFSDYSRNPTADLRKILKGTLVEQYPLNSVTFVFNHDTQTGREGDYDITPIESWFVPLAYAFILLRADCGYPCVFYGDLYGVQVSPAKPPTCSGKLSTLILARKLYAYGRQEDYLDEHHCIGFTRLGHPSHSGGAGMAVIISNAETYWLKKMYVGENHAGEEWTDILRFAWGKVVIDSRGWGEFPVGPRNVGVWLSAHAEGRTAIDNLKFNDKIYKRAPGPTVVS